jgi:hypothetical protein
LDSCGTLLFGFYFGHKFGIWTSAAKGCQCLDLWSDPSVAPKTSGATLYGAVSAENRLFFPDAPILFDAAEAGVLGFIIQ